MRSRHDDEHGTTWRLFARWVGWLVLGLVAVFVGALVFRLARGADPADYVLQYLQLVVFLGTMSMVRLRTRATTDGLEVTTVRTRRIPWSQVTSIDPDASGAWATRLSAQLTDGSTVPLHGVPPEDLPRLEELRGPTGGQQPGLAP